MKSIITIAVIAMLAICSHAETKVTRTGNNFQVEQTTKTKSDMSKPSPTDKLTSYTWTDAKGETHPVYHTKNDAYYYFATSKDGKVYRRYITKEIKANL